jgi:RNA polymerase sigma factor for flagellar operon FliA
MVTTPVADPKAQTDAVTELVESHLPLIGHLVRKTMARVPRHVHSDDLNSAAMMALVLAAQSFDAERGVTFASWATVRINGALLDELRSMDWASRSARTAGRTLDGVHEQLCAALGRTPTTDELAAAMGVSVTEVRDVQFNVNRAQTISLDGFAPGTAPEPSAHTGNDPESMLLFREKLGYLHDAIAELPERLRHIVTAHFFEQRQLRDVADELGVTPSRVSQLLAEALRLLQAGIGSQLEPAAVPARGGGKKDAPAAYLQAVSERGSLASRLAMTTPMGDVTYRPALAS